MPKLVQVCVCGAGQNDDGTFNEMHKDGKCGYNGGAGADGKGGHNYQLIGMLCFVAFIYYLFICLKLLFYLLCAILRIFFVLFFYCLDT